jgi:cobalamin biosynthesis protein CbiM
MHIPDGYLSPATCAALAAGAAPFWYVAMRRVRRAMHTRLVPVLALLAAFSFLVMMLNVPLPGGTTGHATGVGVTTVILGPWASILAVSVALVFQALFFGDGGLTAIGANCLNMAVAGSLVAHVVYAGLSRRAALTSRWRLAAAGLAGYAAANAAALCTAIELGIQPSLYHDAAGAPLYAPYPLGIAVPVMMLGHLTVAGLAEALEAKDLGAHRMRARRLVRPIRGCVGTDQHLHPVARVIQGHQVVQFAPDVRGLVAGREDQRHPRKLRLPLLRGRGMGGRAFRPYRPNLQQKGVTEIGVADERERRPCRGRHAAHRAASTARVAPLQPVTERYTSS